MDVGRSTRVALAQRNKNNKWLAEKLDCSMAWVGKLKRDAKANSATIEKLAKVFELSESEFIKLGE